MPQVRRGWVPARVLLAETPAQWFWMATRAWQSSTRSLLLPLTLGLMVVLTKVPLVQLVLERAVMAVPEVPETC